jgi:hypothetical protein
MPFLAKRSDYLKTPEQALDIAIETLKLERDD